MVRYVSGQTFLGPTDAIHISRLLERLLTEGDGNVHDLAVDAIETVWKQENGKLIAHHFAPEAKKIYDDVEARAWAQ